MKVLNPRLDSSPWGSGNGKRRPTENLALRVSGVWRQEFQRTGGNRNSTLGGEHKVSCTPGPREKSRDFLGFRARLPAGIGGSPVEVEWEEVAAAHCRNKHRDSGSSGEYTLAWALLEAAKIWNHSIACRVHYWNTTGQTTNRARIQLHPSVDRLLKVFLRTQLPTKHTLWHVPAQRNKTELYPPVDRKQYLPPGSLYKPLRQFHPPGSRL